MRGNPLYETADLHQPGVTHRVDITRIGLPDAIYDVVIAMHVVEHIDDDRPAERERVRRGVSCRQPFASEVGKRSASANQLPGLESNFL